MAENDQTRIFNDDVTVARSLSYEALRKLNDLRTMNQFCDSQICVKNIHGEYENFDIHKAIMSASSSYFSGFFNFHKDKTKVIIEDFDASDIALIIIFAYLRDVSGINTENCFKMMIVCDYFGVMGLLNYCLQFTIENFLTPQNCIEIYSLSDKFQHGAAVFKKLKTAAWNYILKMFEKIDFESLKLVPVDFLQELLSHDKLNVRDERNVWNTLIQWIQHNPSDRSQLLDENLFKTCRLGLLPEQFFLNEVRHNHLVEKNENLRQTIISVIRFFNNLQSSYDLLSDSTDTPDFALPRTPYEILFAIGGWCNGAPQSCVEVYDIRSDRWNRVSLEDPIGPRSYHGTVAIDKKIYCIGGFNGTEYFNTCTLFEPEKMKWTEIGPMHCRRCYVSVAVLGGEIYAMGGYDGSQRLRSVEKYCPCRNQWTFVCQMNFQRSDANACIYDNKIFIVGGFNGHECLNSAEYYDVTRNEWILLPSMSNRRSGVNCVAFKNFLYVIGGFNGVHRMSGGEKFDFNRNIWSPISEMASPRSNFGLAVIEDSIIAAGGYNGSMTIRNCEFYDPENDEWVDGTDLRMVRSALTVTTVSDLSNLEDFVHQNRSRLFHEKRLNFVGEPERSTDTRIVLHAAASLPPLRSNGLYNIFEQNLVEDELQDAEAAIRGLLDDDDDEEYFDEPEMELEAEEGDEDDEDEEMMEF